MELFDKRTEFFEKLADLVVTDDIAAQLQQEGISMDPNDLKTMIKSFYTRNWLRKQGIETDFFDLVYDDKSRQDNITMMTDEAMAASKTLIQLAKRFTGRLETLAKNADLDPNESAGGFSGGFDAGGDTGGGEGDLGGGGDDDLDLDLDTDNGTDGDSTGETTESTETTDTTTEGTEGTEDEGTTDDNPDNVL
ncbi:TPA: hypothetical protein NV700_004946 [Escherichia coli]|nr:hypothetical protein [Escherichia coli]